VYTKNNQRTKFQPIFDPTPRLVTETGQGGLLCTAEGGATQRRHADDVRPAVEEQPPTTAEQSRPPTDQGTTAQPPTQQAPVEQEAYSRPARERRPPGRYTDPDFTTNLRPGKQKGGQ
jgi:hypothetical protein